MWKERGKRGRDEAEPWLMVQLFQDSGLTAIAFYYVPYVYYFSKEAKIRLVSKCTGPTNSQRPESLTEGKNTEYGEESKVL